jgi:microcompartment protein CcmK/EutM
MRLGIVKGTVVLSRGLGVMDGTRYLIVEPVTAVNLKAGNAKGGGREVVAADRLGAGMGQLVCFEEGREACSPWLPARAPVDAYVSAIVDAVTYQPTD